MLRCAAQDAWKGRVPDRSKGGIVGLTLLQTQESVSVVGLDKMNLLQVQLDIVEFISGDDEVRIHANKLQRCLLSTSQGIQVRPRDSRLDQSQPGDSGYRI